MRFSIVSAMLAALLAAPSFAQTYPSKPIRFVVTLAAGAQTDRLARALGQEMSESLKQPIVVENKPGGGSIIGMMDVARSPADGHTVVITTAEPLIYNPLLYTKLPYDPDNDFSYVTQLTRNLGTVVVNKDVPANTFPELVAYAKANRGKLNWGTWGAGSTPALYLDYINRVNGLDIAAIPYKGTAPTLPAILSGEIHLTYLAIGTATPLVQAGKIKALAITGANESTALPGIRSLAEYKSDPNLVSEFHVYGPAKVPAATLERLSSEFARAMRTPTLQKLMANTMLPVGSTPTEFAAAIKTKKAEAAKLFKALNVKPTDAPQ
jgi:tripartite-type tricarboxylate transporter receptor subunit TctC